MKSTMYKLSVLQAVKIFQDLPGEILLSLAEKMSSREFEPGQEIFKQGDEPDYFYVIASGKINISANGKTLSKLTTGDFFGELALLDNSPRLASATATTKGVLLTLDQNTFDRIVNYYPEILKNLVGYIMGYLRANLGLGEI